MNSKKHTLYNVIFPIWLLVVFPPFILITLPLNFIVDLTVIVLTLKVLHVDDIKQHAKKVILAVWGFGFLSDFIGGFFMILPNFLDLLFPQNDWIYRNLIRCVMFDPFDSIFGFLWIVGCIVISAACIYAFNRHISFKKLALAEIEKKKLALSLVIFTAPYLFLLPYEWFSY